MMDKKLKWRHLKALHQIYEVGYTKNKVRRHPYISYLLKNETLKSRIGKRDVIEQGFDFKQYYEKEHLVNYNQYQHFLSSNEILTNQTNFSEKDIQRLLFIKEQKKQILKDKYSRKKFSAVFFKEEGAKHLDKHSGLEKAVLSILELDSFPGRDPKDQQYKFVVNCIDPKCIVLCENIDFLLLPWIAREDNIELWYAGGNNISKLDHLPDITLPIYYSCDWDFDGLKIYERIRAKIPQIRLLHPSALESRKSVNSPNHKSDWKYDLLFSNLNQQLYSQKDIELIDSLIKTKEWIEEENNNLIKMIDSIK